MCEKADRDQAILNLMIQAKVWGLNWDRERAASEYDKQQAQLEAFKANHPMEWAAFVERAERQQQLDEIRKK